MLWNLSFMIIILKGLYMAKEHQFSLPAHPNIYEQGDQRGRALNIHFCEPDCGVTEDTGILLLIPGFGAGSNSRVYKKMRKVFSDKYNLITIQCDSLVQNFYMSVILLLKYVHRINNFF